MKLTLIRHGITDGNERRLYYGSTDLPLNEKGKEELLTLRGIHPKAERYYTSGMLRCEQSLELLYGNVPHEAIPELREVDFGDFEMKSFEDLRDDPAFLAWCRGNNEANTAPNGESGDQLTERALRGAAKILEEDTDAVAVIHGGTIASLMQAWFPGNQGRYFFTPRPGRGFTVYFEDKKPVRYEKVEASRFFRNTACEYFPCHETGDPDDFNCLFCYCPLYPLGDRCGGTFRMKDGVKVCTSCLKPHRRDAYSGILEKLKEEMRRTKEAD